MNNHSIGYWSWTVVAAVVAFGLICGWRQFHSYNEASPSPGEVSIAAAGSEPILPLRTTLALDPREVALGKRLFSDTRLSHDDSISCASCHSLDKGGTDGLARSIGMGGALSAVNAPTVFNAALNFRQFWDGRGKTLADQVDGPIHNPNEMASSWPEIIGKLRTSADYVREFDALYPGGLQVPNIRAAIVAFESSLLTPNSRFDKFLRSRGRRVDR